MEKEIEVNFEGKREIGTAEATIRKIIKRKRKELLKPNSFSFRSFHQEYYIIRPCLKWTSEKSDRYLSTEAKK